LPEVSQQAKVLMGWSFYAGGRTAVKEGWGCCCFLEKKASYLLWETGTVKALRPSDQRIKYSREGFLPQVAEKKK